MRILITHNTYQQAGGEDIVVANERALLQEAGHEVKLYTVSNYDINGLGKKLKTFIETPYSHKAKQQFADIIKIFKPDIVHVHNFFPLLTPAIYDSCIEAHVPVVQTLHNYRTICPGALLMRDSKICEKCVTNSPYWGAWHRCYRGSFLGSLAVARMVAVHKNKKTWLQKVDRFIVLTEFARKKFIESGFLADRLVVKPNFVTDLEQLDINKHSGALFVGRISEEKGLRTLMEAWQTIDYTLCIIGDGPMMNETKALAPNNVHFLRKLSSHEVRVAMSKAAFLIMPSLWYEGFPMTIVEAFSCGLPVITSNLGSIAEIVKDGVTGLHFNTKDADDLAAKVRWAINHPREMAQMGLNARAEYERKYTPDKNYRQLISIYEKAITGNNTP